MSTLPSITSFPNIQQNLTVPRGTFSLKVANTSIYDMNYFGYGTSSDDWIPACSEYMLYSSVYDSGEFSFQFVNNRGINPPENGVALFTFYSSDKDVPLGVWPVSIPYPLATATTLNSNTLINTGNPPLTSVINIQPSDASNPTWSADNSGNLTINGDNAGTLTKLLQLIAGVSPAVKLAAVGILVEVLGNLKSDGTLSVVGSSSLDNGGITTNGSGHITAVSFNGALLDKASGAGAQIGATSIADCLDQTSTNLFLKAINGGFEFQSPNGTTKWTLAAWSPFTGTGTGTFNHGLGQIPDAFVCNPCTANGSSQTIGFGNKTSTQVTVTTGAGLGWSAIAIKF